MMHWYYTWRYKGWLHLETLEEQVILRLSTKLHWVDSRCREKLVQAKEKISCCWVKENSSVCRVTQLVPRKMK